MKCKIFIIAALVTLAAALYGQARSITATKAYVDRRYADATNAVPSIVTNEASTGEWHVTIDGVHYPNAIVYFDYVGKTEIGDVLYGVYLPGDGDTPTVWVCEASCWTNEVAGIQDTGFSMLGNNDYEMQGMLTVARPIKRNALGLARLKDIEPLPTYEAVTNAARDVVNSVWDAKLGVAWEARMHDGHLYYIAVTNAPGGAE